MTFDFDRVIDRRSFDCVKWGKYPPDVVPLWIADMDFRSPEAVVQALRERVEHGVYGYGQEPAGLRTLLVERLERLYGWRVTPESLVFMTGVMAGYNLATRTATNPGDGVLIQTPIYYPILDAPRFAQCTMDGVELMRLPSGRYEIDFAAFEAAITPRTRIFILCNPHNPVGRVFLRSELERMAEICLRHDLIICADEIHCDLVFQGHQHIPIASLAPEIAQRTITLMAPTKTFNVAGLQCAMAIVENPELRRQFQVARAGLVADANIMGYTATLAAYRDGQPWLDALLAYLEANRDWLFDQIHSQLPGITMGRPEGTYLAWLDCRGAGLAEAPHNFFLEWARVGLNNGAAFGRGGEGFVRLNFGCPRSTLEDALERMRCALLNA
jgi:cystathionine beta-lyase